MFKVPLPQFQTPVSAQGVVGAPGQPHTPPPVEASVGALEVAVPGVAFEHAAQASRAMEQVSSTNDGYGLANHMLVADPVRAAENMSLGKIACEDVGAAGDVKLSGAIFAFDLTIADVLMLIAATWIAYALYGLAVKYVSDRLFGPDVWS